ncbi:hypothetical protein [Acinetobacter sp. ANC 4193]
MNFKFSEIADTSLTSSDPINFNFKRDDNTSPAKTDFVVEIAYVSESITHSIFQRVEDGFKISDHLNQTINRTEVIKEQCVIADQVTQMINLVHIITERCVAADRVTQVVNRSQLAVDKCSVKDVITDHLSRSDVIADHLTATDTVTDQIRTMTVDRVHASDHDRSFKQANVLVKEKARVTDRSMRVYADTVTDVLRVSDTVNARVRVTEAIREHVVISDKLQSSITFSQHITEKLIIRDVAKGSLTAKQYVQDHIFIDDRVLNQPTAGYAWTANVDTWAMSRYDGYNYQDLAVIDGVLYGLGEDGVYRLDADTPVQGKLVTGKIDLGRGQLVHPVAAYLEYELSGSSKQLQVGVGTTQSGAKQTYFYQLPTETADFLTNGRVLFGRGLRGRHFSFEINISGEHGYINDLNIDLAATKRRV